MNLFPWKDPENKVFKKHASAFMSVIDRCVNDLKGTIPELEKMGKRHESNGVKESHFEAFG